MIGVLAYFCFYVLCFSSAGMTLHSAQELVRGSVESEAAIWPSGVDFKTENLMVEPDRGSETQSRCTPKITTTRTNTKYELKNSEKFCTVLLKLS